VEKKLDAEVTSLMDGLKAKDTQINELTVSSRDQSKIITACNVQLAE